MASTNSPYTRLLTLLCAVVASHQSIAPIARSNSVPRSPKNTPVTLPLARNINSTGTRNILRSDQARAKAFWARAGVPSYHPDTLRCFVRLTSSSPRTLPSRGYSTGTQPCSSIQHRSSEQSCYIHRLRKFLSTLPYSQYPQIMLGGCWHSSNFLLVATCYQKRM